MARITPIAARVAAALTVSFALASPVILADIPPLSKSSEDVSFGLESAEFGMGISELELDAAEGRKHTVAPQNNLFCVDTFGHEVCFGEGQLLQGAQQDD